MPTVKVRDLTPEEKPCYSMDHNVPMHQVFPAGVYEHTCSGCGKKVTFTVTNPGIGG